MIRGALTLIVTLTLGTLAAAVTAGAEQATRVPRIGVLFASTPAATSHLLDGLRQRLRERGYVEGQHIILERRYGQVGVERMSDVAAELVRIKVDVIVAATDPATGDMPGQDGSVRNSASYSIVRAEWPDVRKRLDDTLAR